MLAVHVREEDLELYLHGQLLPDQVVVLQDHLELCERCKGRLRGGEAFLRQFVNLSHAQSKFAGLDSRRNGQRFLVDEVAVMTQLNPLLPGRCEVRVVDVSRLGLKLLVPAALEVGTVVQIRMKPLIVTGEVRHCTVVGESLQAGVQILDLFPIKS
jgi:hypothetical protein